MIDFRAHDLARPADIQPPDAELIARIRDNLPNAKARKDLQAQLDDNEHAIRRFIEE